MCAQLFATFSSSSSQTQASRSRWLVGSSSSSRCGLMNNALNVYLDGKKNWISQIFQTKILGGVGMLRFWRIFMTMTHSNSIYKYASTQIQNPRPWNCLCCDNIHELWQCVISIYCLILPDKKHLKNLSSKKCKIKRQDFSWRGQSSSSIRRRSPYTSCSA